MGLVLRVRPVQLIQNVEFVVVALPWNVGQSDIFVKCLNLLWNAHFNKLEAHHGVGSARAPCLYQTYLAS